MAGKYEPLRLYLSERMDNRIELSLSDIADLVGGPPLSALEHEHWWANDAGHEQANAWLEAGYVASLDIDNERVVFLRNVG